MVSQITKNNLVILKIGGSIITKKNTPFEPNLETIYRISKELALFLEEDNGVTKLIIIHGGGGFSHSIASVYGIQRGMTEEDAIGLPLTVLAGRKLNDRLVESMLDYGLPVLPLQPSACIVSKNGVISKAFMESIILALKFKWMPIMYGDLILDEEQRISVLSGENLLLYLSQTLQPSRAIIFTDVNGIYSFDPKEGKEASLIREINSKNITEALTMVSGSKFTDVTGGMAHKLKNLYEVSRLGIDCLVTNGAIEGNFIKALRGEKIEGTTITTN